MVTPAVTPASHASTQGLYDSVNTPFANASIHDPVSSLYDSPYQPLTTRGPSTDEYMMDNPYASFGTLNEVEVSVLSAALKSMPYRPVVNNQLFLYP